MATANVASDLAKLLTDGESIIIKGWLDSLRRSSDARISAQEVEMQARDLLRGLICAISSGSVDIDSAAFQEVRDGLEGFSRSRALQGFSPSETATFVFSMKEPLFGQIRAKSKSTDTIGEQTWALTLLLDKLGLFAVEAFQRTREELISRQREEIEELSTPVVKLWDGVLALPLIGTLDSARTQVVMQNLLESIVREGADIAILDITGVPTVDTLVAQHLLKTISAARLMGADCIISGIRPQIAQTIVQLGVQLNVVSKATLADAFAMALTRTGRRVVKVRAQARDEGMASPAGE
jgi:rsbT co-antagonist protein RsbR